MARWVACLESLVGLVRPAVPALAVLLGGCSDNVTWAFISNPGGTFTGRGGTVIVVRKTTDAIPDGSAVLSVAGEDDRGEVLAHLAIESDVAVLCRAEGVEVRTPALPRESVELARGQATLPDSSAVSIRIEAPDPSELDARASAPGTLSVAAGGTLLVLEHRAGAMVFRPGEAPEAFPPGTAVEEHGTALWLMLPDRTLRVLTPPDHPSLAERIARAGPEGTVQVLGPDAEPVAVLPEEAVELHGGAQGLFLTASFPDGLNESDRTPMDLVMASYNRFLLRLE